jgi:glyoxylase I family protein
VPTISGFNHVSFSVTDPARSSAWYQEVLGFAHHSDVEGRTFRRIRLRHPDSGITLTLTGHGQGSGDSFDELRTGLDHLAFSVGEGEIDEWKRRFEALGVDHSEVRTPGNGGGAITLRDPDNIQLEVFASPVT